MRGPRSGSLLPSAVFGLSMNIYFVWSNEPKSGYTHGRQEAVGFKKVLELLFR